MGKNQKLNFIKEYNFIKKVMESCDTQNQLKSTRNIFQNFKHKWGKNLECFEMIEYMFKFESDYKKKQSRL